MRDGIPRIVIVGGGFGGLAAAAALRHAAAQIVLIDRTNHHVFQPLLYQVATATLSPGQIASPLRSILKRQKNATVFLAEVTDVDKEKQCVLCRTADREGVSIPYDYLVLATGSTHSYFGHDEYEKFAPGLKSLANAAQVRNRILQAFELAEAEEDPSLHRDLLTFVLVGAGPTGVEMAGAIATLVRGTLKSEFRRIHPESARIVLVDRGSRILATFAESLSHAAAKRLDKLGVEIHVGRGVDHVDADGVIAAGERIASKTVIWTAGVTPSPAGKWLNVSTDRAGRVPVEPDLSVTGYPSIFVVGDTSTLTQSGKPLGGVAQVAIQQGRYAGRLIQRQLSGKSPSKPFQYFDKGNLAVVGKGFAVLESGRLRLSGYLAWLIWAAVHLQFLGQSSLRISVFLQWMWTYFTGQRGARLILNHPNEANADTPAPLPASASPVT